MYPRDFFDSYWRSNIRNEVFVAMPFHDEFETIWEQAIKPAIDTDVPGSIRARRVDSTVLSGSIVTDILDGIAHSRIVLADVSICSEGKWTGQRNANVMYEVGLAHAVRQPTEMCIIRRDSEEINFDVAHINIHRYESSDISGSRKLVAGLIDNLLVNIEKEKSLKVAKAIESLDNDALRYMKEFAIRGPFMGPNPKTIGEELVAISKRAALARLQQLGVIRVSGQLGDGQVVYEITPFGYAVSAKLELATDDEK